MNINFSDPTKLYRLVNRIGRLVESQQLSGQEITSSFSTGQLLSKTWITDECLRLELDLKTVFLCGGWFATLFLDERLKFDKVRSFDIDPRCESIAEDLHRELVQNDWKFKAVTLDIHQINYNQYTFQVRRKNGTFCTLTESPDTIINTSCEHISDFKNWYDLIPENKLLILQSNDGFTIPGHMNCSKDLKSFSETTPLSKTLYSGEKKMPEFTRFMRIGYK